MIGIITLYYSENCGSVLQAGALRHTLKQLGYPAVFIRTRGRRSSHGAAKLLRSMGTHLLHLDAASLMGDIRRYRNFSRTLADFESIAPQDIARANLDALVLGSDTVWDVTSPYFSAMPELFWPRDLAVPVIAYAPSAANATLAQIDRLGYPAACVRGLRAVSARDQHTREIVRALSGRDAPLVLDPTLLPGAQYYDSFLKPIPHKDYLLVYAFERQAPQVVEAIRTYARERGLTLVSMGKRRKWCAGYADASAENFVSYFHGASAVVTNTFHGTIFSILNQRHFVCLGGHKRKIAQFLPEICLDSRIADDAESVARLLRAPTEYQNAAPRLDALRTASIAYLKEALPPRPEA